MDRRLNQSLILGLNEFGRAVLERTQALPIEKNVVYDRLDLPPSKPVAETYLDVRKHLLDVLNQKVYNFANTELTVYLVGLLVEEHMAENLMHLGYLFKTFFRENIILNPRVKLLTALPTILPEEAYAWLPSTRRALDKIDTYASLKEQFQPSYPGVKRALPPISGPPFEDVVFCYSESLDADDLEVSAQAAATKIYFDLVLLPERMSANPKVTEFYRGFPAGQGFAAISGTAVSFLPSLSKLVRDEMEYVLMMRLCDGFFPAGPPAPGTVERRVDELLGKVRALRLQNVVEDVVQHALEKERWFDLASIDALAKYDIEISAPPDAYLQRFLTAMEYERNRFAGRVRDLALEKVLELPEKLKDSLKTGFLGLNLWEMDTLFTNAFFKVSQLLDQRSSLAQQTKNEWQRTRSEAESKIGLLKQISTDKGAKLKHGSETEARIRDVFKTLSVREILEKALAYTVAEGLAAETTLESRLREGYDRIHVVFSEFLKKRAEVLAHLHQRRDQYLRRRELHLYVFNQVFRERLLDKDIERKIAEIQKLAPEDALGKLMSTFFFKKWLLEPALPLEEVEKALMEAIQVEARASIEKVAAEMQVDTRDVVRILQEIADAQVNSIFDMKYKEHPQAAYRQAMFLCHQDEKLGAGSTSGAREGVDFSDVAVVSRLPYQVLQVMEIYNLPFRALRQYASLDREHPSLSPAPSQPREGPG